MFSVCAKDNTAETDVQLLPANVDETLKFREECASEHNVEEEAPAQEQREDEEPESDLSYKSGENECDFDVNPTALFRALYGKQWEAAEILVKMQPKEAGTWISRRQMDEELGVHVLRWRLLPIHCAIIYDAPESLLEQLMDAYPAGALATDDQGMLPHQLANELDHSKAQVLMLVNKAAAVTDKTPVPQEEETSKSENRESPPSPSEEAAKPAEEPANEEVARSSDTVEPAAGPALYELEYIDNKVAKMQEHYKNELQVANAEALIRENQLARIVHGLEEELEKDDESTRSMALHAGSLEEQINKRREVERHLALHISKLDSRLESIKEATAEAEYTMRNRIEVTTNEKDSFLDMAKDLRELKEAAEEVDADKFQALEEEIAELQTEVDHMDENTSTIQCDTEAIRSNAAIIQSQLAKLDGKVVTITKLAEQVTSLKDELVCEKPEEEDAFESRARVIERENDDLKATIPRMEEELRAVTECMKQFATDQQELVHQAQVQETVFKNASQDIAKATEFAKQQEDLMEKAGDHARILSYAFHEKMRLQEEERSVAFPHLVKTSEASPLLAIHRRKLEASRKERKDLANATAVLNSKLLEVMKEVNGEIPKDLVPLETTFNDERTDSSKLSLSEVEVGDLADKLDSLIALQDKYDDQLPTEDNDTTVEAANNPAVDDDNDRILDILSADEDEHETKDDRAIKDVLSQCYCEMEALRLTATE